MREAIIALAALALVPAAYAHGEKKHGEKQPPAEAGRPAKEAGKPVHETGKAATIVGEVIDPVCYLDHDERGPEHRTCAEECAKQGVPLAILEDGTGQIYLSLPSDHTAPNAKLMAHIARTVRVTGEVLRGGGIQGISIQRVEPL